MKIFLGADHNGFHLKNDVHAYLIKRDYEVEDMGGSELDPVDDFPQFAHAVSLQILGSSDKDPRGILLCGGAQGMGMAANRFRGIRASVVWDEEEARMARNDTDSNILCLPARILEGNPQQWQTILDTWLSTPFAAAPRFKRRNAQLDELG